MHRYLKQHRDQLKTGLQSFHQALRDQCAIQQLLSPENFEQILQQHLGVEGPAYDVAPQTKLIALPKSAWSVSRELARKRDEPLPDNQLPLDDNGQCIHPPPPVPFMWPKFTAYHSLTEEEV